MALAVELRDAKRLHAETLADRAALMLKVKHTEKEMAKEIAGGNVTRGVRGLRASGSTTALAQSSSVAALDTDSAKSSTDRSGGRSAQDSQRIMAEAMGVRQVSPPRTPTV